MNSKLEVRVSFEKYFLFAGDDRIFVCVECRTKGEEEWGLDTAYPVENKSVSADIFNVLQKYYDLGAKVIFEF